jgi:hypothetical protein
MTTPDEIDPFDPGSAPISSDTLPAAPPVPASGLVSPGAALAAQANGLGPSAPATPFDVGQANDPNIATKDLSPGAAKARAIIATMKGADARAADIARGGDGQGGGKVSIAPPAPTPPVAGSTAGVTPIGAQPGTPGAGVAAAPTKVDPGFIPARPAGPNTGLMAAQKSALQQMGESDKRTQGALEGAKDMNAAASGSQEDLGFGAQAAVATAQDAAAKIQTQRDQQLQDSATKEAGLVKAAQDRAAALPKEDPKRWWNNKSAGDKVLTGIGLALGTFGSSFTKTPNVAYQMMQDGIAKDVEAQRQNNENEWKKITQGTQLAKDERAKGEWLDTRGREDQHFAYEKAKETIAGYSAKATSDEQRAKLAQLSAGLTQQQEQLTQAGIQRNLAAAQAAAVASAGGGGGPTVKDLQAYRDTAKEWDKLEAEGKLAPGARVGFQEWFNRSGMGRVTSTPGAPGAATGVTPAVAADLAKKAAERKQQAADVGATIDAQGQGLASTALTEHPLDRLTGALGIQGTKGQDAELARQAYEAGVIADVHKYMGVRDPEKAREIAKPFVPQAGDTKATIEKRHAQRTKIFTSLAATPGASVPGLPAGAKEED